MSAETEGRTRKVSCLLIALDAMRIRSGANDEQMHEFVSGLNDQQWADLTDIANSACACTVTHDVPTAPTRAELLDILNRRTRAVSNVQDALSKQLTLAKERTFRRPLAGVR